MSAVDLAEKKRREGIRDHHAQMLDAQAHCVPCKLCGGQAVISDAGDGWGYHIACAAHGEHLRKVKCTQGGIRLSGWAYNVSDLWNRLNAAPVSAGKVKALVWEEYGEDCLGWKAPLFGAILVKRHWKGHWVVVWSTPGYTEVFVPGHFDTPEAAKAAAESRILSALQQGDGWQGIESAPKDGTEFLAHEDGEYYGCARSECDGYWVASCGQPVVYPLSPTHWMPLPAPPSALSQEGVE